MSVWDALVGQPGVVEQLRRAVADARLAERGRPAPAMTHAWLVTGPPGSGRSVAATAFAAALVCPADGCGVCEQCHKVPLGAHVDVEVVRPDRLSYGVEAARELVLGAARMPADGPWHVMVVEDADRMTPEAVSALLKAIEEPTPRTVWLLCAPSAEDVLPTIRSRTRQVLLRTPSAAEVAAALVTGDGVDPQTASFAARASQGHIGRARALALDERVRARRIEVLRVPARLRDVPSCFAAAADLLAAATDDASSITDALDAAEHSALLRSYGEGAEGVTAARVARLARAATKELTERQRSRRTRTVRDQVDRALLDLLAFYRDVLVLQTGGSVALVNEELRAQLSSSAGDGTATETVRRMEAVAQARLALEKNVAPLLALEAMCVGLFAPAA
ncbi:MAG: DNA polymerase III subunit delta' [Actinomycetota bacterium]|nr:MAG: DNA polymerase III subunit delta' [Actinomycetota bacterium]